jgi:diketogulonate reductase-like aldo/keto reductase
MDIMNLLNSNFIKRMAFAVAILPIVFVMLYFAACGKNDPNTDDTDTTPPAEVVNLNGIPGNGQITLNWTDPADEDFDRVEIVRSPGNSTVQATKGEQTVVIGGLTNGTAYTFNLKTVDKSGNKSAGITSSAYTPLAADPDDNTPPAEVSALNGTSGNNQITLNWTDPSDSDFAKVIITYTPGGNAAIEVGKGAQTAIITNLANGTEYTFTLKTVDASGNESAGITSAAYTPIVGNFDHQVTQPAPGGNTSDGGPQAVSNITSVSGVPLVRLNNGVMMPRFGLGTQVQSMEGANQRQQLNETVRGMVISALQSGYRHLDDAMFYYNERGAGWGIRESGIPREEIWLTSKISGNLADAQNAFEGMLQRLQVDYIDLVYIHHPAGTLSDILACWRVMETEYKAGRIRALGISNFDNRMNAFDYIMQNAEIKPQVAQIECHPLAQRKEARQLYADNYDIQVECWYPLNHNRGDINNATLQQIATAHGKSVYQIILRWHMQEGLCPVPGSTNPAHILENISIFDFELSGEEMSAIRAIDLGDAGRSFNISYGDWNFGNFQDYTYDHTYTPPTAIE